MRIIVLALISLLIQGCTVGYYSTDDMLSFEEKSPNECDIRYHIEIAPKESERMSADRLIVWKKIKIALYDKVTKEVLAKNNCSYKKSDNQTDATLNISVMVSINHDAMAVEYLTGLSLGIIPSWGTRHDYYSYDFKYHEKENSYSVDDFRFNHLVVFPVFWVSFFTMDESNIYEKCLDNYVKSL